MLIFPFVTSSAFRTFFHILFSSGHVSLSLPCDIPRCRKEQSMQKKMKLKGQMIWAS